MRLSSPALILWVLLAFVMAGAGSYLGYTQTRERTRELNEIAPLEEGVNIVHTLKLLGGWEEPKLSDVISEPPNPTQTPTIPTATPDTEPVSTLAPDETPSDTEITPEPTPTESVSEGLGIVVDETILNDPRRVTVLVMGIDQRQGEVGPFHTDTMIVLSLDPTAKTGVMLSIPRDLWIDYESGYGLLPGKINNANVMGESISYPGGGPEFAKRTVQSLIGQKIHYYILVNFDAFTTLVNAIGEVEVCPAAPIDDPKYPDGSYGYLHVTFEAGCQNLGAERLLQYARTRATQGSDIDRANRQQETILAIRKKVVSLGGATSFIGAIPEIWESVQANVRTDLNLDQLIALAFLAQEIPPENIHSATIGYGEVLISTGPNNEDILIPIKADILELVSQLFTN